MKEAHLLGKLLPSHPDILPILEEIREKYQIPEISPTDNSLKIKNPGSNRDFCQQQVNAGR